MSILDFSIVFKIKGDVLPASLMWFKPFALHFTADDHKPGIAHREAEPM